MKKIFFLFLWGLIFPVFSFALNNKETEQASVLHLDLPTCIRIAMKRSHELHYNRGLIDVSGDRILEAKKDFFPSGSLAISSNKIIDVENFSYYDPQTGQTFVPGEGYQFSVRLRQPLYSGSKLLSNLRLEKSNLMLNEIAYRMATRDLWLNVTEAYLTILERQADRDIRMEQVNRSRESLALARSRLAAGKGIRYEVLLEEAYAAQSKLELMQAEHALHAATRNLLILLKYPLNTNISLEGVDTDLHPIETTDDLLIEAFNNRDELRQLSEEIESYRMQLKILKSVRKPSLDLFATYGKQGTHLSDFQDDDHRWTIGVSFYFSPLNDLSFSGSISRDRINSMDYMQRNNLSIDFLDGSSILSRETEFHINIILAQEKLQEMKRTIENEVLNAHEQLIESAAACETERLQLKAAEENKAIQEKSYQLGLTQFKDVVDARTDVITARINLNYAYFRYALDRATLDYVVGRKPWKGSSLGS